MVGAEHPHAAHQHRHLMGRQPHQLGAIQHQLLRSDRIVLLQPVAVTVGQRLKHLERRHIGLGLTGITTTRAEGDCHLDPGGPGRQLNTQVTRQHYHIRHADLAGGGDGFEHLEHPRQSGRFIAFPLLLRGQPDTGTVGTATQIRAPESTGAVPGGTDHIADGKAAGGNAGLHRSHVIIGTPGGNRILPDQIFSWHIRPHITAFRPQIPVGQLEPGAGKGIRETGRISAETLGDLAVLGVELQRHVGVCHDGVVANGRIFHIHRLVLFPYIDGLPLPGTGRALFQFPLVVEQQVEVAVVPTGGVGGPGPFNAAGHRIATNAALGFVEPAQPLILDVGTFRLGPEQPGIPIAVTFAYRVPPGRQGDRLFVIHRHAGKGDPHVLGGFQRIRIAVDPFRVDVDEPHHHCRQRVVQIPLARVTTAGLAARCQPLLLRAPIDVFLGVPDILAAEGEAERLEPHGLISHGAGQNDQIGPADLVAVLFLDGPQQTPGLVQVGVVRPGVERSKTLIAGTATTTAIGDTVGTGRVPGHADHQAAVVAPVCRPPILAVGHQGGHILLEGGHVELLELFPVIETGPQRIGLGVVLMENVEVEALRPPRHVGLLAGGGTTVHDRAFSLGTF